MPPEFTADLFVPPPRRPESCGLYLHLPWCAAKCDYCDFASLPLGEPLLQLAASSRYTGLVEHELSDRLALPEHIWPYARRIDSIYFGGGTPSLFGADYLADLLLRLRAVLDRHGWQLDSDCEVSFEGNPAQLVHWNGDDWQRLAEAGFNRVSWGVQSLVPELRHLIGRRERAAGERGTFSRAELLDAFAAVPFCHKSADLIYGIDASSIGLCRSACCEHFYDDVAALIQAGADHLSLYALSAEEGTMLNRQLVDEAAQAEIFAGLPENLIKNQFYRYEVSNYARSCGESRHNLRYWLFEPWIGLGPGAHGCDLRYRYANAPLRGAGGKLALAALGDEAVAAASKHCHFEPIEPQSELPLSLMRLAAYEIEPLLALARSAESKLAATTLFEQWHSKRVGTLESAADGRRLFRWRSDGYLFLDHYIAELVSAVSG